MQRNNNAEAPGSKSLFWKHCAYEGPNPERVPYSLGFCNAAWVFVMLHNLIYCIFVARFADVFPVRPVPISDL